MQTPNKDIVDLIVQMNQALINNPMLETIAKIIVSRRKNRNIAINEKLTESETEQINNLLPIISLPIDVSKSTPAPVPVPAPGPIETINDTSIKSANFNNLVKTINENITKAHKGIINSGNICYLSSYIQLLSYIPDFIEELITHKDQPITIYKIENQNKYIQTNYNDVIDIFYKLYSATDNIKINNPIFYKDGAVNDLQEDSLEGMENFFKRINLGLEYFKVTEMSNNICLDGKNISKKEEKSLYLALSINDSINNIPDLLTAFQAEEEVEDFKDEDNKCGKGANIKMNIKKNISIKIPTENKYLLLQLKRFSWDFDTGESKKIDQTIELNKEITIDGVKYILYGIIKHIGNTRTSGHYIYYKINDDKVIEYDDSNVTEKDYSDVKDELEKNGYLVIYKRSSEMTGGDIYYQKYLKYKNKYLKLKNQVS